MTKQCSSCGGDCGRTKKTGCRYRGNEMNIDRELLQQARDAFDLYAEQYPHMVKGYMLDAAQAIRARLLTQPEQEPVAWSYWQSCLNDDGTQTAPWVHRLSGFKPSESIINKDIVPLYTAPQPAQKPLTDEKIEEIVEDFDIHYMDVHRFVRAIEAAHNIKETK